MNTIYLDSKDVPQYLRGGYEGKKFKAIVTDSITVPQDAGVWGGGSRETYRFVELSTGRSVPSPCQQAAPWDKQRQEFNSPLPVGIAMVEHSMFCGKDMGLTFYVHPDSAAKLLPADSQPELNDTQKLVLEATGSLKASYNGKDRYENSKPYGSMSHAEVEARLVKVEAILSASGNVVLKSGKRVADRIAELKAWTNFFPSREEWESAKAELITLGYLNKAGAITNKGMNAR
jgi:hypothetical protein